VKRFWLALALCLIVLVGACTGGGVHVQDFPKYVGYVNDFAGLLSSSARTQLEAQLTQLEQDTTAEVVVVTVDNLNGSTPEYYANELFNDWGIGKKSEDNGILFLVAFEERQTRIEVGYGLESIITDGRAGRILDNDVIPHFKNGDYEQGIISGVASIEGYIRGDTSPSVIEENPISDFVSKSDIWLPTLIIMGVISIYLLGWMARTKSFWLGGVWGVICGLTLGFAVSHLAAIIGLSIGLGLFGTFLDLILSRNYRTRKATGKSTSWTKTWGGFSSGGGSSSHGGFGGFGGGHSGGGGAGRGW
jgi:uncharacterized protein